MQVQKHNKKIKIGLGSRLKLSGIHSCNHIIFILRTHVQDASAVVEEVVNISLELDIFIFHKFKTYAFG